MQHRAADTHWLRGGDQDSVTRLWPGEGFGRQTGFLFWNMASENKDRQGAQRVMPVTSPMTGRPCEKVGLHTHWPDTRARAKCRPRQGLDTRARVGMAVVVALQVSCRRRRPCPLPTVAGVRPSFPPDSPSVLRHISYTRCAQKTSPYPCTTGEILDRLPANPSLRQPEGFGPASLILHPSDFTLGCREKDRSVR